MIVGITESNGSMTAWREGHRRLAMIIVNTEGNGSVCGENFKEEP